MPEAWKKWEGQVVNEEFPLLRYLGGSERSAVFLTKRADREPQEVAIKLILANAENPELQLSWWELAAKLSHPNLLRLFQMGRCELDGTQLLYAVSEYAEESLAQILPYRALTPAEARDTLLPLLDVLAYIHAKGFVHGHIKPANIMAVGDLIKVSSDGLCGVGESSRVLGTTSVYAAPEIADGAGMAPASDVWSLGISLVEALTQSPPVWRGTEQAELVLPESLPFFDIANHCLRRNPQQRWTVPEIAKRLNQAPLAPQEREKEIVQPKSSFTKWGYLAPAIGAGIVLLAVLGSRVLHHHPSGEQAASQQKADVGQPAQNTPGQKASSAPTSANAPPVGAKKSTGARTQGAVAHPVMPDVSNSALRTVQGKVKVRIKVTVDSSGNVVLAKFDSRGPSKYFADRTLQAARQWTFKPPQVDGRGVPSEWVLKFEFARSGATVHPAQTFP
jgi:TonB family protein